MRGVAFLFLPAAVLLLSCGSDQERSGAFRYTLTVAPGNYLFVGGREFHGDVACMLEPGDSLRIGGFPILPRRNTRWFSEEELSNLYGEVPFIQQRVREGATWHQGSAAFHQRVDEMVQTASLAYTRQMKRTGSPQRAKEAALASLDWSLLEPGVEPEVTGRSIKIRLQGFPFAHGYPLRTEPPPKPKPEVVTPDRARQFLESMSVRLRGGIGVYMEVVTMHHKILRGAEVAEALKQIEETERGNPTRGPLSSYELDVVLGVRREQTK